MVLGWVKEERRCYTRNRTQNADTDKLTIKGLILKRKGYRKVKKKSNIWAGKRGWRVQQWTAKTWKQDEGEAAENLRRKADVQKHKPKKRGARRYLRGSPTTWRRGGTAVPQSCRPITPHEPQVSQAVPQTCLLGNGRKDRGNKQHTYRGDGAGEGRKGMHIYII